MRSPTPDVLRSAGLLLVVAGHSQWLVANAPEAVRLIYLFHMPLFFFASGLVFRPTGFRRAIVSKFDRLLIPYIVVGVCTTLYYIKSGREFPFHGPWLGLLWGTGHTVPWTPLWFLPTLFLVSVSYVVLQRWLGTSLQRFIGALTMLLVIQWILLTFVSRSIALSDVNFRPIGLPWGLDILPICLFFFALGDFVESQIWIEGHKVDRAMMLFGFLGLAVCFFSGARLDLNYREFAPFPVSAAAAVSGVLFAFGMGRIFGRTAGVASISFWFAQRSMIVYLFHSPIQGALLRALPANAWSAALAFIIAIVLPVVLYDLAVERSGILKFAFGGGRRAA